MAKRDPETTARNKIINELTAELQDLHSLSIASRYAHINKASGLFFSFGYFPISISNLAHIFHNTARCRLKKAQRDATLNEGVIGNF